MLISKKGNYIQHISYIAAKGGTYRFYMFGKFFFVLFPDVLYSRAAAAIAGPVRFISHFHLCEVFTARTAERKKSSILRFFVFFPLAPLGRAFIFFSFLHIDLDPLPSASSLISFFSPIYGDDKSRHTPIDCAAV